MAKTIKGYGLGEAGEGRNVSHQAKKLNEAGNNEALKTYLISEFHEDTKVYIKTLERQKRMGTQSFKAEELATLREVVSVYGDLLKEVTHAQFQRATAHTNANVTRILKNKGKMKNINDCVFEA